VCGKCSWSGGRSSRTTHVAHVMPLPHKPLQERPINQDEAHAEIARLATSKNYAEAVEGKKMDAAAKGWVFDWGKFHDRQEGRAVERREKRGMAYSSSPVNYNDDGRQQKRRRMRSPSSSASSYYRLRRCSSSSSHQSIRNSSHKNGDPKPRNRVYHYQIHAEPGTSIVIN
jgi:hypothetical protein